MKKIYTLLKQESNTEDLKMTMLAILYEGQKKKDIEIHKRYKFRKEQVHKHK